MNLHLTIKDARRCQHCAPSLPNAPRPLIQGSASSRLLIIGQAPGSHAHATGIPWDDQSGSRLRTWLGLSAEQFYSKQHVALMPMGFCYPGKGRSGDLPPRRECAPRWHPLLLNGLSNVQLTIYVGRHAFDRYLSAAYRTLTNAVSAHMELLPARMALPHPSPRNNIWLKKHPWFEVETLPALRDRITPLFHAFG